MEISSAKIKKQLLKIQLVFLDKPGHGGWHEAGDGLAGGDTAAHLRAAAGNEAGVGEGDAGRESGGVEGCALARIDNYAVGGEDVAPGAPLGEAHPVVGADEKYELMGGVSLRQRLQRAPHIRRTGKRELTVGSLHARFALKGKLYHAEAQVVVKQGFALLEGVLRRDYEPYFIKAGKGQQTARKLNMAVVHGIERAPEYSDFWHWLLGGLGLMEEPGVLRIPGNK